MTLAARKRPPPAVLLGVRGGVGVVLGAPVLVQSRGVFGKDLGCKVYSLVLGQGFRVQVYRLGFRVQGFGLR